MSDLDDANRRWAAAATRAEKWHHDAIQTHIALDAALARERRLREAAGPVVALLLTSGKEPPPLNDYGLMSILGFYAGPNARAAVDWETAKRVTALSEATRNLRAALAETTDAT